MKNLVLGASGKIGNYYLERSQNRYNIFASRKKNVKKNIIKVTLNLKFIKKFLKEKNISSVVILTAISNPEDCKKNKKLSKKINIDFVKGLVKILIELKIYFIFFSSEYVYSGLNKSYLKYNENSKIGTKMIYGKQKIEIEKFHKKLNIKTISIKISKNI